MKKRYLFLIGLLSFVVTFVALIQPPRELSENKETELEREKKKGRSGAMESLEFWSNARAYPETDVPKERYFSEYRRDKLRFKRDEKNVNAADIWEPMGPFDLQGRSLSVAVNPQNSNTIYVGSASGGLWRSYTHGEDHDWLQVPLGFPALGISSILIDPVDTNIMYVGTGEVYRYQGSYGGLTVRTTRGSYGIGILKSTDGGFTWIKSFDWTYNQQSGIQKLLFNPLNPNTIWAGTTEGLYVSRDAGANWNSVLWIRLVQDIVIQSADTNNIMMSVGNFKTSGYGVYTSTNGGGSFNPVFGLPDFSGKTALGMYASDENIVYASVADDTTGIGALWKTTNFGTSWSQVHNVSIFGVQGWYSHFIAVHPTNPNLLCHASVGIVYSDDAGSSFNGSAGYYSDNHGYAIDPNNPDVLYSACDDGIYRSTDFGKTFTDVGTGMMTGQFYAGFSNSEQDSMLAIGQSQDHIPGYIFRGSINWDRSVTDESGWTATDPTNDNIMYADSRYGNGIYKSTDRGNTFNYVAGLSGFGSWNAPLGLCYTFPTYLYFAKDKVYKSTNSASSWAATNGGSALDGNPAISMAISPTSRDTVFVGNAPIFSRARIWRTVNGGTSWSDVTGSLPDRYPLDLVIDPNSSRTAYVAFGGFGTGKIYKTTDVGANWTDITGTLPDVPTTAIAIDPLNTNNVYAGNDIGVYLSTDGGTTWNEFGEGLPDAVIVADLVISPSNRALRCVTHGNGVYERKLYNGTSPAAFDYRAFSFISPSDNGDIIIGSSLKNIKATFRSNSGQDQTDSFDVTYRLLYQSVEKFSTTKRVKGMTVGETRLVEFSGSYIPADTGFYEIQAITSAGDPNTSNDTLKGMLEVTAEPTISHYTYSKIYQTYSEIEGGNPGPKGDDAQKRIAIPFAFTFDGYAYDSLQMSTNGWIEFGSGTSGTVRGLSTSGQLGGYYVSNTYLGTTDRPTKLIAPWWTDSHSGEPGGSGNNITYTTLGSTPNRIFVMQWKNIRANYDTPVTTYVNYQIRLYEGTNQIDVSYGPVTLGTFYGEGAAFGVKDYKGGDYRFFDLSQMKTGSGNEVVTSHTPYDGWPGADSCFRIIQNAASIQVSLNKDWNLISLPVKRNDNEVTSVYTSALNGTTFKFASAGYVESDSLMPGGGYWTKFPSAINMIVVGNSLPNVNVTLKKGWNIIGGVDNEIATPTDPIISSEFFGYDLGYSISSTLVPGKGYWVKASDTGTITIGDALRKGIPSTTNNKDRLASIVIEDNDSHQQRLFVAGINHTDIDITRYEMPPMPPEGSFDVRYSSNRMLEKVIEGKENIFPIQLTSAKYPLTITVNPAGNSLRASMLVDGKEIPVKEGNSIKIPSVKSQIKLKITNGNSEIPTAFALEQNYPNPFNPATMILYSLPTNSHVTLKVYDLIGREVATLVDGMQDAGFKSQTFDGSGLASGVYLYQLKAGDYSEVKKLVLMK